MRRPAFHLVFYRSLLDSFRSWLALVPDQLAGGHDITEERPANAQQAGVCKIRPSVDRANFV